MSIFRKIAVFNKTDTEWNSIFTVFFVILFLTVLLISLSIYLNIYALNDDVYEKILGILSYQISEKIGLTLSPYDEIILLAGNLNSSDLIDIDSKKNAATDILNTYPELDSLSVVDKNGGLLTVRREKDAKISINTATNDDMDWEQGAKDSGSVYWSEVYHPFDDGMPYMTVACSIYGEEGDYLGSLGLHIPLEKISSCLDNQELIDNGEFFILGQDHQIIAYSVLNSEKEGQADKVEENNNVILSQNMIAYSNKYAEQGKKDGYLSFRYKSKKYYAVFLPLDNGLGNKWVIGIVLKGESFFPSLEHLQWLSVVINIPLLLMVLFYILHKVEQKGIDNRLIKIATTDQLTSLSNRYNFNNYFTYLRKRTLDSNYTFSIAMADIDYFKEINDEYGHSAGDYVLSEIGHLFKKELRNFDYICRWGGEEFLILLTSTGNNYAKNVAEKLRLSVKNHRFVFDGRNISLTISFGVTENDNNLTCEELVSKADRLLYEAKTSGRDRVVTG